MERGKPSGQKVNLVTLGINNGWVEPAWQYEARIDYAVRSTYRQLLDSDEVEGYHRDYEVHCGPLLRNGAFASGDGYSCQDGDRTYNEAIEAPLELKEHLDVYDIRAAHDLLPPGTYADYITSSPVKKSIGVTSDFKECADDVYQDFASTGDSGRSFLHELTQVIIFKIMVLIWAGAAAGSAFKAVPIKPYTAAGKYYGEYKTLGNLNLLRVY